MTRAHLLSAAALLAACTLVAAAHADDPPDLFLDKLLQYTWNGGTGTKTWQQGSNWTAPTFPEAYPYTQWAYPNDSDRPADEDEVAIEMVIGANLSVPLAGPLTVDLIDLEPLESNAGEDDIHVASLKLGSTTSPVKTEVAAPAGRFLSFENRESNDNLTNPGDPSLDPPIEPEPIYSFNQGRALIWSTGVSGVTNEISADVRLDDTVIVEGDRSLTISGDVYESTVRQSRISSFLTGGATLTITGNVYVNETDGDEVTPGLQDRIFRINSDRGFLLPADPQMPDETPEVPRDGNIDIVGQIIGDGHLYIGAEQSANLTPVTTIFLRNDNSQFTGRISQSRSNLVLGHDNALGAPTDAAEKGLYRTNNPNQGFGFNLISDNDNRKISTDMSVSQWQTIKGALSVPGLESIGDHSLELAGTVVQENTRGFINLLPYDFAAETGSSLKLSGPQYPLNADDADEMRIYTIDGPGMTVITGGIHNRPPDTILTFGDGHFRKRGSGTVVIGYDGSGDSFSDYSGYTWVEGGHLRFASNDDLPNPGGSPLAEIISTAGAVGVDSGVLGNTQFLGMLNNKQNPNHPAGMTTFFRQVQGPRAIYNAYDHGGLMLGSGEYASNLDFTTGDLANAANMSLAAQDNGSTYSGTITPANNAYRLGGGSATLTMSGTNKLTLARQVVVTNGGTVAITGTHDYTGKTTIEGKNSASVATIAANDGAGGAVGENVSDDANATGFVGTTLRATTLANGGSNSSIGKSSSAAANLLIQAGTLQYAGAATSTDRLFTLGTRGGTLDASGTGALVFSSTSALAIDTAEDRPGYLNVGVPGNRNDEVFGVPNVVNGTFGVIEFDTSDLVPGMAIYDVPGPPGTAGAAKLLDDDSPIHITGIPSPHVVRTSELDVEGDEDPEGMPNAAPNPWQGYTGVAIRNIQFGPAPARYLTLTGTSTHDNTLNPIVGDASDKGEVINGFTHGGDGAEGSVGIRKTGTGTWLLAAENTYTGQTQVQGGTLKVTGSTGTGDTVVSGAPPSAKGTLMGSGNVMGNLIVQENGVVNPGLSPGELTVAGDYTQDVGAQLTIEIAGTSAAQYDRLTMGSDEPTGLLGDYNGNDEVDSADYTVWRDAVTAGSSSLLNDPTPGTVTESDFTYWRDNYGDVLGAGSNATVATLAGSLFVDLLSFSPSVGNMFTILTAGSVVNNGLTLAGESAGFNLVVDSTSVKLHYVGGGGGSGSANVPEPTSLALVAIGLVLIAGFRRTGGR